MDSNSLLAPNCRLSSDILLPNEGVKDSKRVVTASRALSFNGKSRWRTFSGPVASCLLFADTVD